MKQEILQDRFAVMNKLWQKYSLFYALRSIRAAGFSKVDLWAGEPHLFIPDCSYAGLKTVRRFAASLGLTFSCLTPEMNGYPLSAAISDMGMRERAFQYGKKCIDAAEALEAGHVLFAPGWRYETDDRRESIHRTAEFLLEMADYAEHKGVLIETQHLTPFSSNLVNTIDDLQELADFLDDRIGFVADTSILCGQGEKIEDYLNAFGNRIRHIHLTDGKDGSLHIIPGEGTVPWKEIVETCPAGTDRIAEGWFHTLEINAVPCLSEPETSIQKTYHWLQAIDAR